MNGLTAYRPNRWDLFDRMRDDMESAFGRFFGVPAETGSADATAWTPRVDIAEVEKAFVVTADLPGVDPKNVEVTLHDGVLTVQGERKTSSESKDKSYHRTERFYGKFFRSIQLPNTVDAEHVTATADHGVLTITIPKRPEAQPKRISVK